MSRFTENTMFIQRPSRRRTFLGAVPLLMLASACAPQAEKIDGDWETAGDRTDQIDHTAWDNILSSYVIVGEDGINRFDYAGLQDNAKDELIAYVDSLEEVRITEYPKDEQYAYWVNLYNAATVEAIIENYPLESIRDIGLLGQGPWDDAFLIVENQPLTLNNIEHGILRPIWQDVRIHYAVNCASIGCPNLATKAYTAADLEEMLEEAATSYVNHPRGFEARDGELIASNIYDWYQVDWGDEQGVLDHAREYAEGDTIDLLENATSIGGYDYDWALNESN
ncbi:MAG: DUF547 domain-containing protein [Erythrobacter sp.]